MELAIPTFKEADLERILVSKEAIAKRVEGLGREISAVYGDLDVTLICILSGAMVFTADLIRQLDCPTRLDCLRAESYGNRTSSTGLPRIAGQLKSEIAGKHVLIIDDILDSGRTLRAIHDHLTQAGPASLRSCVLLDKAVVRATPFEADFVGFRIPDEFVVGYGLDFAERYRSLSCIGSLKPEFQVPPE